MTKHQHIQGAVDRVPGLDHSMESAHLSDLSAPSDKLSEESVARGVRLHDALLRNTLHAYHAPALTIHSYLLCGTAQFLMCVSAQCHFLSNNGSDSRIQRATASW